MKAMHMIGQQEVQLHAELIRLKRTVRRAQCVVAALIILMVVFFIVLVAVAASQAKSIRNLRAREGLLPNPNVTFATQSGDRNVDGLTYGGSLYRGSGFWAAKKVLQGGSLTDHAAIGYNEVVYIIGGAKNGSNVTDEVWKYDAILHTYQLMSPMPKPRYRFGAVIINDTIYVVGGRDTSDSTTNPPNNGMTKTTFIYDIIADKWTTGADALDYQGDNCAAALGGKVYMIGGYGLNYSLLATATVYDPVKNDWARLPDMPTPRGDLMCVALNGEVYVLGGYFDLNLNNAFSSKMESFNPTTQTWTQRPDLLTPRGDAGIAVLDGQKIMLIGGEGHYLDNQNYKYPKHVNEIYYATDQTWVQKAMIPTARFRTAAANAGGLTFVMGGADVCVDQPNCPALDNNEVFLDVDHPHVYVYLKNEAYNDNAQLTTYPL